jgi:hypothetical protein
MDDIASAIRPTASEDWAEAKLTRAAQSLNDVYEYMSHGKGQQL